MEELYKDDKIKAECMTLKENMESCSERNEPIFTKILPEFHICLDCGNILIIYFEKDIACNVYQLR